MSRVHLPCSFLRFKLINDWISTSKRVGFFLLLRRLVLMSQVTSGQAGF